MGLFRGCEVLYENFLNNVLFYGLVNMKKSIVFFDGDGTLWYPKKTKHTKAAHWIYELPGGINEHVGHLMLVPEALSVLKKLRKMGVITILLSTHPHPPKEADVIINHKVRHFSLEDLFDEIYATRPDKGSKGDFIVDILKRLGVSKSRALMVGDSYIWDYLSARHKGIDALLIVAEHRKDDLRYKRVRRKIKKLPEVLEYV